MLSILCHFHGLLFAQATLGFYSYVDQRNGSYSEGMFVVIVVDECFGDLSSFEGSFQLGSYPGDQPIDAEVSGGLVVFAPPNGPSDLLRR